MLQDYCAPVTRCVGRSIQPPTSIAAASVASDRRPLSVGWALATQRHDGLPKIVHAVTAAGNGARRQKSLLLRGARRYRAPPSWPSIPGRSGVTAQLYVVATERSVTGETSIGELSRGSGNSIPPIAFSNPRQASGDELTLVSVDSTVMVSGSDGASEPGQLSDRDLVESVLRDLSEAADKWGGARHAG